MFIMAQFLLFKIFSYSRGPDFRLSKSCSLIIAGVTELFGAG